MEQQSGVKRRRFRVTADDEEEDPNDSVIDEPRYTRHMTRDSDEESLGSNPDDYNGEDENVEDEEGEDLADTWLQDYTAVPELDRYDANDLASDKEEDRMTYAQRRHVTEMLDQRDRERMTTRETRIDELADYDVQDTAPSAGVFRTHYGTVGDEGAIDEEDEAEDQYKELDVNLEGFDVPLREWIAQDRTRREIKKRFKKFIHRYRPSMDGPTVYPNKIRAMCAANSSSLEVSYVHLGEYAPILAIWLADLPRDMLGIFDEVLKEVVLEGFTHYTQIAQEMHVRITDLPISDRLRDLRQGHLNCLVRVSGVITRRTGVFPQMKSVSFRCTHCSEVLGPFAGEARPHSCTNCSETGPFKVDIAKTEYGNYQKITLQESPGSVPPGRVPRYKDVVLLGDLIDIARPGEEVEVTGVYRHAQDTGTHAKNKNGFPVFSTIIDANFVQRKGGNINADISEEDKRLIVRLGQDPQIVDRIIKSIAPSIYGHRHVKTAVALSLFGGCAKDSGSKGTHRVRGDINVLLLGDPGTAKSQLLKYVEKTAPRAVYSTGKGASAVGLTAGVHKDPLTKEWTLEGGALVLADQGVCLIDEFDKMNEQDRTSIHEAMEQQTISVAKAGILTSLQARCAVIAAANPISGRYDPSFTLAENVELTDPILQRFDVLCVLQDIVDPVVDEQLANFVVNSHMRSHPNFQEGELGLPTVTDDDLESSQGNGDPGDVQVHIDRDAMVDSLPGQHRQGEREYLGAPPESQYTSIDGGPPPVKQDLLKKYIKYARAFVKPVLREVDSEKVASLYADLRAQSTISGGVPIAVRHIESIMRMAEATARMHLRDYVRDDDVDFAIKVMLESFLQAQKVSVKNSLQRAFRKYITFGEENNQLIMHQLQGLIRDAEKYHQLRYKKSADIVKVYMDDLENRAKSLNIFDLRPFYDSMMFRNYGLHLDERNRMIVKTF
mmetsp:Transcript_3003/g.4568  ORF Transcript_3003/g.4568 Transcript_3003/m.4568 type:complete len:949 (+) Transcript_3003:31-2877(+)